MLSDKKIVDFCAFGDETEFKAVIAYAVVCLPENILPSVEAEIRELKKRFAVSSDSKFHCKVAFHLSRRTKSEWKDLSEAQVITFLTEYLGLLSERNVILSIGAVHRDDYPKVLPAYRKIPFSEMGAKQLHPLLLQAAMLPIVETFSSRRIKLWVDPVPDRIYWFGQRMRVDRNYKAFVPDSSGSTIEPQKAGVLPLLLEAADMLAFVGAHALSFGPDRYKRQFVEIYGACSPLLQALTHDPAAQVQNEPTPSRLEKIHKQICDQYRQKKRSFHQLPIGTCVWMTGYTRDGHADPCVLMKVPNGHAQLLASKRTDIRAGVRNLDGEPVVCVLFRFEADETIYSSFIHHRRNPNDSPIGELSRAGRFRMVFYEDKPNSVGEVIQENTPVTFWQTLVSWAERNPNPSPIESTAELLWDSM